MSAMNPKALRYLMGHGDIFMTRNDYAHAACGSAKAELERVAA